jgi:RNA polymerase sigma-70 factor (ECF subfamily)
MNDRGASPIAEAPPVAVSPPAGDDLAALFAALRDELVSTLWFVLGNRDDALDAAQDAFLKCWRARDGMAGVNNPRAWVFRVALNAAKDLRRSAWRRKARPLAGEDAMYADAATPPTDRLEHAEDLDRLRDALAGLREEEKEVFLLRQNGGLTYEQIAEARSSPVGTVKTQMRSALMKLRKVLA